MTQDFDAYVQGLSSAQDNDALSVQRAALGALLHLARDKAEPVLAALNTDLPKSQAELTQQFEQDQQEAESVHQSQLEEEQGKFDDQTSHIQSDFQKRMHAVNVDAKRKHTRIATTLKERSLVLTKEKQEKLLVAEFMSDGAVLKAQQRRKTILDTCVSDQQNLTRMAEEATALLTAYRRQIDTPDPDTFEAPVLADQSAKETFKQYRNETQALLDQLNQLASARLFLPRRPSSASFRERRSTPSSAQAWVRSSTVVRSFRLKAC